MKNSPSPKIFHLLLLFLFFINFQILHALTIVVDDDVSVSAVVGADVIVSTPSGGGSVLIPKTAVQFSGYAYPKATVHILKEGVEKITVTADQNGYFSALLEEKYKSNFLYTLFAVDTNGVQSVLINYPLVVYDGYITHLSGVLFAPTIKTDKIEVLYGDYITVRGFARPSQDMEVYIGDSSRGEANDLNKKFTLTSRSNGTYEITLPLLQLPKGDYVVYVKYLNDKRISKLVKFVIGEENIKNEEATMNISGDCNFDNIINLVDFSVLAFWYSKPNPPVCVDTNRDGIINLIDFSILAFYWTG